MPWIFSALNSGVVSCSWVAVKPTSNEPKLMAGAAQARFRVKTSRPEFSSFMKKVDLVMSQFPLPSLSVQYLILKVTVPSAKLLARGRLRTRGFGMGIVKTFGVKRLCRAP